MERYINGKLEDWGKLSRRVNKLGWFVVSYQGAVLANRFKLIKINSCYLELNKGE